MYVICEIFFVTHKRDEKQLSHICRCKMLLIIRDHCKKYILLNPYKYRYYKKEDKQWKFYL